MIFCFFPLSPLCYSPWCSIWCCIPNFLPLSFTTLILIRDNWAHSYIILIVASVLSWPACWALLGLFIFSHGNALRLEVRWGWVMGALLKNPCPFHERPTLSASQRSPLCVDVFDGGLVIFMRQHVWLTTGGLCKGLSLQTAVGSIASSFASYGISMEPVHMMSQCKCDIFNPFYWCQQ